MVRQEAAHAVKFNREARTPFALYFTGVIPEVQEIMIDQLSLDCEGNSFPVEITDKAKYTSQTIYFQARIWKRSP